MKRKIALLLAAVMTLAPATSALAASTNNLTQVPTIVGKSVLYEEGWLSVDKSNNYGGGYQAATKSLKVGVGAKPDVDYVVDGTDLVIQIAQTSNKLKAGDRFKVVLENAKWFFRGNYPVQNQDLSLVASKYTGGSHRQPFSVLAGVNGGVVNAVSADAYVSGRVASSTDVFGGLASTTSSAAYSAPTNCTPLPSLTGTRVNDEEGQALAYDAYENIYSPTNGEVEGEPTGAFRVSSSNYTWMPFGAGSYWSGGATDSGTGSGTYLTYDPTKGVWGKNYTDGGDDIGGEYYRLPQILYPNVDTVEEDAVAIRTIKGTDTYYGQGYLDAGYAAINAPTGIGRWDNVREVPYKLSVNHLEPSVAVITVLNDVYDYAGSLAAETSEGPVSIVSEYGGAGRYNEIRIPLVIRTTESTSDVKVKIDPQNIAAISSGTWLFSQTAKGATKTTADADDIDTARDNFAIDKLKISEVRIGSFKTDGIFYLKAADHFTWKDPIASGVKVGVVQGLSWGPYTRTGSFPNDPVNTNMPSRTGYGGKGFEWAESGTTQNGFFWNIQGANINSAYTQQYASRIPVTGDYDFSYRVISTNPIVYDRSVLEFAFRGVQPSTDIPGAMYIENLEFAAEENAPYGDIMFTIGNVSANNPVTEETFKAGIRAEWDIILKAEGTIPELTNGRYEKENPLYAADSTHKAARVLFSEASTAAWWASRQTEFTLIDQAKWRKVKFVSDEVKNLEKAYEDAIYGQHQTGWRDVDGNLVTGNNNVLDKGLYINDGEKHGYVTINGNTMTWNDLRVKSGKKASIRFDSWISIESGFEGDVKLSVTGSAIPSQSNGSAVAPVTIAKAISPIKVVAKVKDIKIGYQFQQTEDIIITETKAGMLQKDKDVFVSVTDLIDTDMAFSNETKIAVTAGNLKIKDVNYTGLGYAASAKQGETMIAGQGGTIKFTVSAASSQASTVTISNVSVKVNRSVPESNLKPYKVVVWGPSVSPNYVYFNYNKYARDKFATPGIMTDYLKVVSSGSGKSSILEQEVRVTIGESYFTVNGVTEEMDAVPYISEASNSTMVPVRFISKAFGLSDNQVIWDDENKTVTIVAPNRVVQFKANSSVMKVDGSEIAMSTSGYTVSAEIVNARMYVPFRAMGDAFGITVVWDDATKTAIYNPKVQSAEETATDAAKEETKEAAAQ